MREYFVQTRYAASKLGIPAQYAGVAKSVTTNSGEIRNAFIKANPGLDPFGIKLQCHGAWLQEVRICLDGEMAFRQCWLTEQDDCEKVIKLRRIRSSQLDRDGEK